MSDGKARMSFPETRGGGVLEWRFHKSEPSHTQHPRQQRRNHTAERLPVCVKLWLKQAKRSMLPTIDFLLCVPIFTWKCNNTVITPLTITTHGPTPQAAAVQAAIWREADHRLSAPGSSHSWHSGIAGWEGGMGGRDEREEELMKEGRIVKEM